MSRTIAAILLCLPVFAAERCVPMTPLQRKDVETYVRKKFKVGPETALKLTESAAADSTCFRKVEFASATQGKKFGLTLFVSPDARFMTTQLMDIRIDPEIEERKKQQAFRANLNPSDAPSVGPANAPVTITVFSDFQCPYCSGLAKTLRNEILPKEKGNVRMVFRYFPLEMHSWAKTAAEAEVCASAQNPELFWKLHDFLFENQRTLTPDTVTGKMLEQAGRKIDKARFTACMTDKKTDALIQRDVAFGSANGVRGTPTMFINGQRADVGAQAEQIRSLIREASARASR
jgi:protein-disulfide isomerase